MTVDAKGAPASPVDVRARLVPALELDLVGPWPGCSLEKEALYQAPSRWYLTGFLVPVDAGESQRTEPTDPEVVDELNDAGGTDDAGPPEPPAARKAYFPSSIGMSLLVPRGTRHLRAIARWGNYRLERREAGEKPVKGTEGKGEKGAEEGTSYEERGGNAGEKPPGSPKTDASYAVWQRTPREGRVAIDIPEETVSPVTLDVPESGGIKIALSVRPVKSFGASGVGLPTGTRSVSVFLVNARPPAPDETQDQGFIFQPEIEVESDNVLVPRRDGRGLDSDDWDEKVADLQYRDLSEYAVGHGVATNAILGPDGHCRSVKTCWMPRAEVERVAPAPIAGVELAMEALANLADGAQARASLGELVASYRTWIAAQKGKIPVEPRVRKETGEELIARAGTAAARIEAGIDLLNDPQVLDAFRTANRVMARSARRRFALQQGISPEEVEPPRWRPFQLAFLLMNLPGIADASNADREVVDLLFFPTGGGKTEAYLGLAAFTLVLRRLRNPGLASAGLSVLMRYTLRLLTLDQLSRAAALICALELERLSRADELGEWPFEIGLWVGLAATPNRMGLKGDGSQNSARARTIAYKNDDRKPIPIPIEECPWCGTKFSRNSFDLVPHPDRPDNLLIRCMNPKCDFTRNRPLPIIGVDEPIYRRLPCFLIATVDKFAAMPWTGQVGTFFGKVDRADKNGFYGPCNPGIGTPLPGPLLPPDLVIQDELHLISGPMGTMVGLYETALDGLCEREMAGSKVRPKIVASTATVRRAENQIRAIFNRRVVDIFPPPGPHRRDSFFATVHAPQESNARLYVGVAAQGRSLKVVLLRAYLALLGAAQKAYDEAGGKCSSENPADPYMTLVGYFNSLRELGGSRRIVEDEVGTRLTGYGHRRRVDETEGLFSDRRIAYDVVELTSRVTTDKVAEAKRRLSLPFIEKDRVDVAIATNMISVGLDITRLGLMVVLGQPKTSAEYIQATSRVGRDPDRPGLVVTLLNIHKPRDRSHYERFGAYHHTFYRSVEATSVTPFSPRALDRGLAGTLVALCRLGYFPMTPPKGATKILDERTRLEFAATALSERAGTHAPLVAAEAEALRQRVLERGRDLLDEWSRIAHGYQGQGVPLQYQTEEGGAQRLLYDFLDPDIKKLHPRHLKFRANRSMRDVEPEVNLWLKTLQGVDVGEVEE